MMQLFTGEGSNEQRCHNLLMKDVMMSLAWSGVMRSTSASLSRPAPYMTAYTTRLVRSRSAPVTSSTSLPSLVKT